LIFEFRYLLIVAILLAMASSAYFDCAQLFARLSSETRYRLVVLSIANWWQYIARLCNMGFAMILAVSYEMGLKFKLLDILIIGYLCTSILVFFCLRSNLLERLVSKYAGWVIFMPSYELRHHRYWRKLNKPKIIHVATSFGHAILLHAAILAPFFLADLFPNFRMSAVYFGQLITFMATFYLMVHIDPLMNKNIDNQQPIGSTDGLIYGRFFAMLFILFALLLVKFFILPNL
jgi:hypothetical protein